MADPVPDAPVQPAAGPLTPAPKPKAPVVETPPVEPEPPAEPAGEDPSPVGPFRFDFAGPTETVFPDVLTAAGSLVCQPGDVDVVLATDPHTPLLVPVDPETAAARDKAAATT